MSAGKILGGGLGTLLGAGGAAFSPLDISDLILWLDADDGANETGGSQASDGEKVTDWLDQSAESNDFGNGDGPAYRAGEVNGRGACDFTAGNLYLEGPTFSAAEWASPFSIAFVFQRGSTAGGEKTLFGRGGSTDWRVSQQGSGAIRLKTNGVNTYEWLGVVDADYALFEIVLDANHDATLWKNGVSQGTVTHTAGVATAAGDADIGGIGTVLDSFAKIAEFLWYGKDLEAAGERSSLSSWLLSRYGL